MDRKQDFIDRQMTDDRQVDTQIDRYAVYERYICCLQKTHLRTRDTHRLKGEGWKKIFHENENVKKKAGVATLISDKIELKIKTIIRHKERNFIMKKRALQ